MGEIALNLLLLHASLLVTASGTLHPKFELNLSKEGFLLLFLFFLLVKHLEMIHNFTGMITCF